MAQKCLIKKNGNLHYKKQKVGKNIKAKKKISKTIKKPDIQKHPAEIDDAGHHV